MSNLVTPYNTNETKKAQVAGMFNNIAPRYDLLNQLLSAGIHHKWRKKMIGLLQSQKPSTILDVATGTGDVAIEALRLNPSKIIGIDISDNMIEVGQKKIEKLNATKIIELKNGDCENLTFADNSFDAVTVSFGVRNFENLEKGLENIYRVLKPGGQTIILEFSMPTYFPIRQLYKFYFSNILPVIGKIISKDRSAYKYLFESVEAFPYGERFCKILSKIGFSEVKNKKVSLGIATIYIAKK